MDIYNKDYGNFVGGEYGYSDLRNKIRVKKFTKIVDPQKNEKILDIGCNKGLLVSNMSLFSDGVIGVDINKELLVQINDKKLNYMSATELKFPDNTFDKACAFEVVEHIPEINKVFSEASRVLKIGGKFFISFPFELVRGQSAIIDACCIYKNLSYARKLHVHKLFPSKIKKIISNLPFFVVKTKIIFIPFPSFLMILEKKN